MKAGQPHSSAEKQATLSPAHTTALTVKQLTLELKTWRFVEEKKKQKCAIKQNRDNLQAVIIYIASESGFFTAGWPGHQVIIFLFIAVHFWLRCL